MDLKEGPFRTIVVYPGLLFSFPCRFRIARTVFIHIERVVSRNDTVLCVGSCRTYVLNHDLPSASQAHSPSGMNAGAFLLRGIDFMARRKENAGQASIPPPSRQEDAEPGAINLGGSGRNCLEILYQDPSVLSLRHGRSAHGIFQM